MMSLNDHAKQRATERYGVRVNRAKFHELCNKIKSGKARYIRKATNTRIICEVDNMIVVYSKKTKKIVTFLPANCYETEA